MSVYQRRGRRLLRVSTFPFLGVVAFVLLTPVVDHWRVNPEFITGDTGHTVGDLIPVNVPVSGTVFKVNMGEHKYVKAGTVLLQLDPTSYRLAVARARARTTTARGQAGVALAALADEERAVTAGVGAALGGARTLPPATSQIPIQRTDHAIDIRSAQAQKQMAAAQANVLRAAQAQLTSAQHLLERDRGLLVEGAIPSRQLTIDTAAYAAARAQVDAANAAVAQAQAQRTSSDAARPDAPGSRQTNDRAADAVIGHDQKSVSAAADDARAAQAELMAVQRTLDRDKTLLADGAIPAQQVSTDTTAYELARARADAADAAVRQAQAQLATAREARQQAQISHHAAAVREQQAAHVEALALQAEARIARAQQRAQELAAAQAAVVDADGALSAAEVNLSRTLIRAPVDGWVTNSTAKSGQVVRSGQSLMSLAIPGHTWVVAGFPATQRSEVRAGDSVRVRVDAYRPGVYRGAVISIGKTGGRFTALAPSATPVPQGLHGALVSVQIALDNADGGDQLPAGLPAEVSIDTRHPRLTVEATQVRVRQYPAGTPQAETSTEQKTASVSIRPILDPAHARGEQSAQIAGQERRVLAHLDAESGQIRAIILSSPSRPGHYRGPVPTLLNDAFLWPVPGEVTSGYGWRIHPIFHTPEFHTGVDIAASWGAAVVAPADGTVIFTGSMSANGMLVILDHGNGLSTTYSHLSSFAVRAGDHVRKGQLIARIGSTGWSTGPHLFFEVRDGGKPVDPLGP